MIYIITPYLADFKGICREKNWNPVMVNGHPRDQNIKWIYNWGQFMGIKIYKADIIIWGEKCSHFDPKLYNKIYEEIELRKRV